MRDHLHPGADQRDQLPDEEEPEIAMPQRTERGEPAAPVVLRGNVPTRLINLGGFYFRNGIDGAIPGILNSPTLPEPISLIEYLAAMTSLCNPALCD
ncbi:MAG: hypothetical protein WCD12_09425 [Candidatus Binatus sp.]|uniref:hypothetical protein n=1 Tax=Candidatus Binatus sp. TaxID=2811406 RepID=UPI003C7555FB